MKKLMFAAAVAAGLAAFGDGLESQNTVGYSTFSKYSTLEKKTMTGSMFVSVGQETLDISNITMPSSAPDAAAEIWWWDSTNYSYTYATWFTELYDEDGVTGLGYSGWGDFETWCPVSKSFAKGEGFWIQPLGGMTADQAQLTIAGEVASVDASAQWVAVPVISERKTMVINPMPVGSYDITDIAMDESCPDAAAEIWWWDATNYSYTYATWFTELYDEDGVTGLGYAGWGDFETWCPVLKTFADGEGFWVQPLGGMSDSQYYLLFKNPFYSAN